MNRGSKDEGEDHGAEDSADNSYGERLKHLRALADSEGQREHAGDRGKSGHGDGTKAPAASVTPRIFRAFGFSATDSMFVSGRPRLCPIVTTSLVTVPCMLPLCFDCRLVF